MITKNIGWIGLGKMGVPMCQRMVDAGYDVTVYNRHAAKTKVFTDKGAKAVESPDELLRQCAIVIIMVTDDQAVKELFTGDKGLLSADAQNKLVINMSSVSPRISKEMAAMFALQGNQYIDAPVSGSVKQAQDGQLVIMCGGTDNDIEPAKPVLEKMGKLILRVGDTGAGNTAKLAINTLLGFYAQGLAEAIVVAEQNGIDPTTFMELLNNGALANAFTKIKGDAIQQDNFTPAFALKHIVKDVALAKEIGLDTPMANTMLATFTEASQRYGDEDIIAIVKHIRETTSK